MFTKLSAWRREVAAANTELGLRTEDWGQEEAERVTEQSGGGQREGQCRVLHTSIHQSKSLLLIAATEVYEGYKVI